MAWYVDIGLETHVQLNTASKLFSQAPASYCANPNEQANALDFGLPGTLPVLNREAVTKAIRFGLAVNATVALESEFARKHYFYPDLPKGYQISQFEHPIIIGGQVEVTMDEECLKVPLVRAHLEEDAGKLLHDAVSDASVVDLNRAGIPLLEIVSEPALHSAQQASAYGRTLHELVCWLNICNGNMQEGSLRFDVNISLRTGPDAALGTRAEIKNLNSFRFMEQAITHEIDRQGTILATGEHVIQETRQFDPSSGTTRSMRTKEEAEDYRYMPDPDLLPLRIDTQWLTDCRNDMPELPADCRNRLIKQYGLSAYNAVVLTATRSLVEYYEVVAHACGDPQIAANWVSGDLAALCKEHNCDISSAPLEPLRLAGLINNVIKGTISGAMGKELLTRMWQSGEDADTIIASDNLSQISDAGALEQVLADIITANPKQVAQYRSGKDKLLGFFVGQAMKATQGKGNPRQLSELARKLLDHDG